MKWRRQHGIGPYIVDFYSREKSVVLELDGSQHIEAKEYDRERDAYMNALGIKVLRFWNNEIDNNFDAVIMKIRDELRLPPL